MSTDTIKRGEAHLETKCQIVGRGTLAGNGLPFLLVSSASEPGRVHVVCWAYEGADICTRVHCDCVAASYGKGCRHVRLVLAWLIEQMTFAPVREKSHEPIEPEPADAKETAILRRNQEPFSLLK